MALQPGFLSVRDECLSSFMELCSKSTTALAASFWLILLQCCLKVEGHLKLLARTCGKKCCPDVIILLLHLSLA
jgi:hypothetical protein